MALGKYILGGLDDRTPIREPNLFRWGAWLEQSDHVVAQTGNHDFRVSTVFLGLDHNFLMRGPPHLFETMVFGGEHDREVERYSTWAEAEAGHRRWCALVFGKAYAEATNGQA